MTKDALRQIDVRALRYFSVLAEELHFGRAAARLNISQPPLSLQIRLLEERLGTALFRRTHHKVELTAAGATLKDQAALVFLQLEKAIEMTRQTARGHMGFLEIGVISSSMVGVVPETLRVFRERYPQVHWQLHELTPNRQIEGLLERRIDVCLFRMPPVQEGLHNELIMYEALYAALPQGHRLAQHESVSLQDLRDEPFVIFGLGQSRFANFLYQCCVQAGFTPIIHQQVVEVQTQLSLVGANLGVALLPASMQQIAPPSVVFKPIQPAIPKVPLYAIYRDKDDSAALRLFLDVLREKVGNARLEQKPAAGRKTSVKRDRRTP